jgi:hypothetical protein
VVIVPATANPQVVTIFGYERCGQDPPAAMFYYSRDRQATATPRVLRCAIALPGARARNLLFMTIR